MGPANADPPRVLWIGCCDCQLPPHDLIGLHAQDVVVYKSPANMASGHDLAFLATLELAVERYRISDVIVCGHYDCAAVRASMEPQDGHLFDHWIEPLRAVSRARERVLAAIAGDGARANVISELNVREQVIGVVRNPLVRSAWRRGQRLAVRGVVASKRDGLLREIVAPLASEKEASALERNGAAGEVRRPPTPMPRRK